MPQSNITVIYNSLISSFELAFDDATILSAALEEGIDVPYSCKAGVCGTCRAKLMQGEVEMDICYGLEPEEVQQGFILTCQSRPLTENIVVDFDI